MNAPRIDWGSRAAVLQSLVDDVNAAGGSLINIDPSAGEMYPSWVVYLNQISAAVNALGANPPLPIYSSLDYGAFDGVAKSIDVALGSIPPPIPPPANVTPPGIQIVSGNPVPGQTAVNGTPGSWNPPATGGYRRQWYLTGVAIPGATTNQYLIQDGDVGGNLQCGVIATGSGGVSQEALSNILIIVALP